MIAASSLAFPGSKTLASWWQQLESLQRRALWVGHLLVHRLEALAELPCSTEVDSLHHMILQALALESAQQGSADSDANMVDRLHARLFLDRGILIRVLNSLRELGFTESTPGFTITDKGNGSLKSGHYESVTAERCLFTFVERLDSEGRRLDIPHFVSMGNGHSEGWLPDAQTGFDASWMQLALAQTEDWKEAFGFPREILAVQVRPDTATAAAASAVATEREIPPGTASWRSVTVDYPEKLLIALVHTGDDRMLGLSARQQGWALEVAAPLFRMTPQAARAAFPDLTELSPPHSQEAFAAAWQGWCADRQIDAQLAAASQLSVDGHQLRVLPSAELYERLQAGKAGPQKREAWLLVGDGFLRQALQILLENPA